MGVQCVYVQGEEMFLSRSTHRCVCVCIERDSVTELALLLVEVGLIIL